MEICNMKTSDRKIRVYMDGCFDLLHYGHCNALRQASREGDILVAGVHGDDDITQQKGPPVFNEQERYAMVKQLRWVYEIMEKASYLPNAAMLDSYQCDFCVHGDDATTTCDGEDAYKDLKSCNRYRECKRTKDVSTTDIIDRILDETIIPVPPSVEQTLERLKTDAPKMDAHLIERRHTIEEFRSFWSFSYSNPKVMDSNPCRVIYVAGDFDLFHFGHLEFLMAAHQLGDYLIVGVQSDQTIKSLAGSYPIMNFYERILIVSAMKCVSEVIIDAPSIVAEGLINTLNIDLVCRPTFSTVKETRLYEICQKLGKLKEIARSSDVTTIDIKNRVLSKRKEYTTRNEKKNSKA